MTEHARVWQVTKATINAVVRDFKFIAPQLEQSHCLVMLDSNIGIIYADQETTLCLALDIEPKVIYPDVNRIISNSPPFTQMNPRPIEF